MEKMPFRSALHDSKSLPELDEMATQTRTTVDVVSSDWREQLPVLTGRHAVLRELRASDAASLFALLTTEEVARFISPPPSTVDGFERFIAWTHRQRIEGRYVCFAVTVKGHDTAIGIFQVRQLDGEFTTAEWGFAIGSAFWGSGLFEDAAQAVLGFTFDTLNVHRLEARSAVLNGRGNGALMKLGAVREALLRKSFLRNGQLLDQALYSIVADEWRLSRGLAARADIRFGGPLVH
jgi:RimJ/RimL family protein N-acetyltransferase